MYHGITVLCPGVQVNQAKLQHVVNTTGWFNFFLLSALVKVESKITKAAKGNINFSANGSKGNCNIKIV